MRLIFTTVMLSATILASGAQAESRKFFSCKENPSYITSGVDLNRLWEGNLRALDGPGAVIGAGAGSKCISASFEFRNPLLDSEQSDAFGFAWDGSAFLNARLFEIFDVSVGYKIVNFAPLDSSEENSKGFGDVHILKTALSLPRTYSLGGLHTFTPTFGFNCYSPENWNPLLSADKGCQIRASLSYRWEPDKKLGLFASIGVIYDWDRTLVFEKGVVGAFTFGFEVELHRFLSVSLLSKLGVQESGKLDGGPVQYFSTPVGTFAFDPREPRPELSGELRLMFITRFPSIPNPFSF